MKERVIKLLTIKSIVTILFVGVVLALSMYQTFVWHEPIPDQLWTMLGMIIAFYFGTQKVGE